MIPWVVLAVILCVLAFYGVKVPLGSPRQLPEWWQLVPVTPDIDPGEMHMAAATLRHSRKKVGTVTIVRRGTGIESSQLWLGIKGAPNPLTSAERIAAAGGCKLGTDAPPPQPNVNWDWWYSTPFAEQDAPAFPAADNGNNFADQANRILEEDDYLFITARPQKEGRTVAAAALSTNQSLAAAWTDAPPPDVKRPPPHPASLLAAVGGAMGAWPLLAAAIFGLGRIGIPAVVGGVIAIGVAIAAVLKAFRSSPMVHGIANGGTVPLPDSSGLLNLIARMRKDERPVPASIPFTALAAWVSGGGRTAITAPQRLAPEAVTAPDGALIGRDLADQKCYLTDYDRQFKVFVLGDPGKGKTTLLFNLLASDCQAVANGTKRGIVWIETKGQGANEAAEIMRLNGVEPLVLSAADTTGPRLELIDWKDPDRSASVLTEAMRYAFDPSAIMEQSAQVLVTTFRAAVAAPDDACADLGYSGRPDIMELGYWMLGGDPESGSMEKVERAMGHIEEFGQVLRYTKHMSKRDQQYVLEPTRNKLQALRAAKGLWIAADRPTADLATLIQGHHAIVLNLGPTDETGVYTKEIAKRCAAMLMYTLWDTIKLVCDSWQDQNLSLAIYSDELADIAGFGDSSIEVIQEMADQGRSRGVLPVFATQHYSQIPDNTLEAIMGSGTRAFFGLNNADIARRAAADLFDTYTPQEVASLPVGHCAVVVSVNSQPQKSFTLHPYKLL